MEFSEFIEKMSKESKLNFSSIIGMADGITIKNAELNNALGVATYYELFININKLNSPMIPDKLKLFVLLHEIAHYKRMQKYGLDHYIGKLSNPDFNEFFDYVIEEEIFADKLASLMYYKLNGEVYPKEFTQQLDLKVVQNKYKPLCRTMFGIVNNTEDSYKKLIKTFLI